MKSTAAYRSPRVGRQPRPLLQVDQKSQLLNLSDLGPLVGITTKASTSTAPPTQAQTNTRPAAQAKERATNSERVLPAGTPAGERLLLTGKFEGGRLKAIDADAQLAAKRVKAPDKLEVENVHVVLHLKDGLLKLDPFDVDFAGGRILSVIDLEARQPMLFTRVDVRLERLQLARLLPQSSKLAPSKGVVMRG